MKKIIMLCTGNICRSPMAEGLLKTLSKNRKDLIIDSAGCESFHTGENPDERAIETMQKHGIDISNLTARPLEFADVEPAENIIMAATKQHLIYAENKRLRCNGRAKSSRCSVKKICLIPIMAAKMALNILIKN